MSKLKLIRRLGVIFRNLFGGNYFLHLIEKRNVKKCSKSTIPPLFIIGAPRTGSTFFYQLMINRYQFAYISNISSVFYKSPVTITKLFKKKIKSYSDQKIYNEYGLMKGFFAPSESAGVYKLWFENKKFYKKNKKFIQDSVYSLSNMQNGPFLSKNMNNTVRLEQIYSMFPDALFVHLERDIIYTAQSILIARKNINKNIDKWWSTKPLSFDQLVHYDPYTQVLRQSMDLNRYIKEFLKDHPGMNYIQVNYEELCSNPLNIFKLIENWYQNQKYNLKIKSDEIKEIKISEKVKLPIKEWNLLKSKYKEICNNEDTLRRDK